MKFGYFSLLLFGLAKFGTHGSLTQTHTPGFCVRKINCHALFLCVVEACYFCLRGWCFLAYFAMISHSYSIYKCHVVHLTYVHVGEEIAMGVWV